MTHPEPCPDGERIARARALDLFCGLGGASAAWREAGWEVVGVDIVPPADIITDLRGWHPPPGPWDLVWASPPCTDYARDCMPWKRKLQPPGWTPDLSLWGEAERIIAEAAPRFAIIENVRGAIPYHGKPVKRYGSRCLWGNLPPFMPERLPREEPKEKMGPCPDRARLRSRIPYALSQAVVRAVEVAQ